MPVSRASILTARIARILILFSFGLQNAQAATMVAHIIDVWQGAAALLEFPCGAVLIDTGGETTNKSPKFSSNQKAKRTWTPSLLGVRTSTPPEIRVDLRKASW